MRETRQRDDREEGGRAERGALELIRLMLRGRRRGRGSGRIGVGGREGGGISSSIWRGEDVWVGEKELDDLIGRAEISAIRREDKRGERRKSRETREEEIAKNAPNNRKIAA